MLHAAVHPSLPASGVTHTVSGLFSPGLPASQREVVVVCGNHVVLYRTDTSNPAKPLRYVMECALYAPPFSVATCRAPGAAVDAIAMLFDDFHVSFIQFNPLLLRFDTVALVQLDDRGLVMERCALPPLLRVDPTGTFVAVLAKRRELFVFPLLKKGSKEERGATQSEVDGAARPNAGERAAAKKRPAAEDSARINVADSKKSVVKVALDAWGDEEDEDEAPEKDEPAPAEGVPPLQKGSEMAEGAGEGGVAVAPRSCALERDPEIIDVGDIVHVTLCEVKDTLRNVRDLQFVETTTGEPLMVFLYEKQPTWAGRVKLVEWRSRSVEANMLTCSILWVKLTLGALTTQPSRLLPIGDVDHLPFNTTHLTPVPAFESVPSAVFAVGRNMLVHVSTKNGYGAYINRNGHEEVQFARSSATVFDAIRWLDAAEANAGDLVRTNLNLANATVLPLMASGTPRERADGHHPELLLFTEDEGTVVRLTVQTQGYAVSGLTASIVMTGCFCSCYCEAGRDLFFLGSYRGDSRVVQICKGGERVDQRGQISAPITVQQTIIGLAPIHDADALDFSATAPDRQTNSAEVASPEDLFGHSIENSPYAELYHSVFLNPVQRRSLAQRQQAMDLVVCSGIGHSGALCVLRHSIRDNAIRREGVDAISAFFLESRKHRVVEVENRKRSRSEDGGERHPPLDDASRPAHLLMTGSGFTILFAVRSDSVQQVRGTVLNIMSRTLFASELASPPSLLQVTDAEFRVASLDGKRTFKHVVFNASVGLSQDCGAAKAAFCVPSTNPSHSHELLFVHFEGGQLVCFALDDLKSPTTARVVLDDVRASCLRQKSLELVAIQGMDLVFVSLEDDSVIHRFPNFALLPPYALENVEVPLAKLTGRLNEEALPTVTHMQLFEHPASPSGSATRDVESTLVLLVTSGELLTYKLLADDAHGPRRLLKHLHRFSNLKPEREVLETVEEKKKRLMEERLRAEQDAVQARYSSERLIPFDNIGGYVGIYVCGQHPVFLIYDALRQELVASRHQTTDAVRGFCPFRSRNVRDGYVYCSGGYVHFATMQPFGQPLGHGWWMQRVPLGQTPHHVAYGATDSHCFVVTSTLQPFSPKRASFDVHLHINYDEEGNKTISVEEPVALPPLSATSGAPVPLNERFAIQLVDIHDGWRCEDKFLLEENEKVLSVRCVEIPRDTSLDVSPRSGMTAVCVVATAFPLGEHVTTRGRLLLLTSRRVRGRSEIFVLHSEPLKGPATAVAGIDGSIVVAVGGTIRVFRYDHDTKQVETVAMLYAGAYVTHLTVFRDYLLFGDLYHSVTLARFSAEGHTLTVLGRDLNAWSTVHTDILYRGTAFGLLATDDERNLALLGYTPRLQGERGGGGGGELARPSPKLLESILTVEAEYRVPGGSILKMLRLRSLQQQQPTAVNVYVTELGALGFLVPINDQVNRTAQWVTRRLQSDIAHPAGLPPRMFLGFKQDDCALSIKAKEKMIHAPLLNELFCLDLRSRKAVAAAAQTQLERVFNAAVTIYVETFLF